MPSLNLPELAAIFFRVGSMAFGGGAATLAMLHNEFCVRRPVLTEEEFQVLFGLSRMVPGMNLLSLTVLLGHRFAGPAGSLICLASLTLPSFTIIVLACLFLREGQDHPLVQGAVRGLGIAAAALLAQTGWQFCRGALVTPGPFPPIVWVAVVVGGAGLAVANVIHPAWMVLGGGLIGVLVLRWREGPSR